MKPSNDLGQQGESIAIHYLLNKGYTILEKNYRIGKIEIDIIAEKDHQIVVVEVKARESSIHGSPEEAVDDKKENFLLFGLEHYLLKYELECEARIDIIAIEFHRGQHFELRHHEGAVYGYTDI